MKRLSYPTGMILVLLIALKLWLITGQAVKAVTYAAYDELLFLKIAQNLINGEWLGPYDLLTLIKGPFFPAFIAGSFALGIPLLLAQQLVYIAACLIFTLAVLPLLMSLRGTKQSRTREARNRNVIARNEAIRLSTVPLFTLLLFNPVSYEISSQLVIRDFLYTSLTLLSLAGALGLALRWREPACKTWPWALVMGLSLAAFWLTREEGVWLLPALAFILVYVLIQLWFRPPSSPRTRRSQRIWGEQAALWIGGLAIPLALTLLVSSLNWANYGLFAKSELDSPVFKSAYGALTRVKAGEPIPLIPVTRKMRKNIYDVSPAFAELRPYLEGEVGAGWAAGGGKTRQNRDEIQGGGFVWAFRDAVSHAGYYAAGKFPAEYYQRVAAEINHACDQHWLDCYPLSASMTPPWQMDYLKPLAKNLYAAFLFVARHEQLQFECAQSSGVEAESWIFRDLTHAELCGWNQQTRLAGWVESTSGPLSLAVKGPRGDRLKAHISQTSDPQTSEVSETSEVWRKILFTIDVRCPFGCQLELAEQDDPSAVAIFPFKELSAPLYIDQGSFHLMIEENAVSPLAVEQARMDALRLRVMQAILWVYQFAYLPLILLALGVYLALSVLLLKRKTGLELWLVASVLWVALASRLLLIAMIHITSFNAMRAHYLAPAYPMMTALICLLLLGGWGAVRASLRRINMIDPRES